MSDPLGLLQYQGSSDAGSPSSSEADTGPQSSDASVDSAAQRAAEAEARLHDYGAAAAAATSRKQGGALPSAADAFDAVDDAPEFLHPEATRPIITSATHGLVAAAPTTRAPAGGRHGPKGRVPAGAVFDIAKLAPQLKGQQQSDKRGPPGAVIEAKAKRNKLDDGPEATQQYTAAQIAMMGGNVPVRAAGAAAAAAGEGEGEGDDDRGPRKPSKAMGVSDFLDKGGGALLPRKAQDRRDKEKRKRELGQSAIGSWKTEAEMVLRQQYDS